jgi:hypothetical protein
MMPSDFHLALKEPNFHVYRLAFLLLLGLCTVAHVLGPVPLSLVNSSPLRKFSLNGVF